MRKMHYNTATELKRPTLLWEKKRLGTEPCLEEINGRDIYAPKNRVGFIFVFLLLAKDKTNAICTRKLMDNKSGGFTEIIQHTFV